MFNFLGCLFVLIFGIVIIAFAFLGSVIDIILTFLGLKKRVGRDQNTSGFGGFSNRSNQQRREQTEQRQQSSSNAQQGGGSHHNGKIFEKDDSEYVDFEEI